MFFVTPKKWLFVFIIFFVFLLSPLVAFKFSFLPTLENFIKKSWHSFLHMSRAGSTFLRSQNHDFHQVDIMHLYKKSHSRSRGVAKINFYYKSPARIKKNSFPCSMGTRFSKMEGPLMKYWFFFFIFSLSRLTCERFLLATDFDRTKDFQKKIKTIFAHFLLKY